MSYFIENSVSVVDVAAELKQKPRQVEDEAATLALSVGIDWAGHPALSATDARALVSGSARRDADHQAEQYALAAKAEAWVAERHRVVQEAQQSLLRGRLITPSLRAEAAEAGTEAGRRFERKIPAEIADRVSPLYGQVA